MKTEQTALDRRLAAEFASGICVHKYEAFSQPGKIGTTEYTFYHAWQPGFDASYEWCPRCGCVRTVEGHRPVVSAPQKIRLDEDVL